MMSLIRFLLLIFSPYGMYPSVSNTVLKVLGASVTSGSLQVAIKFAVKIPIACRSQTTPFARRLDEYLKTSDKTSLEKPLKEIVWKDSETVFFDMLWGVHTPFFQKKTGYIDKRFLDLNNGRFRQKLFISYGRGHTHIAFVASWGANVAVSL